MAWLDSLRNFFNLDRFNSLEGYPARTQSVLKNAAEQLGETPPSEVLGKVPVEPSTSPEAVAYATQMADAGMGDVIDPSRAGAWVIDSNGQFAHPSTTPVKKVRRSRAANRANAAAYAAQMADAGIGDPMPFKFSGDPIADYRAMMADPNRASRMSTFQKFYGINDMERFGRMASPTISGRIREASYPIQYDGILD